MFYSCISGSKLTIRKRKYTSGFYCSLTTKKKTSSHKFDADFLTIATSTKGANGSQELRGVNVYQFKEECLVRSLKNFHDNSSSTIKRISFLHARNSIGNKAISNTNKPFHYKINEQKSSAQQIDRSKPKDRGGVLISVLVLLTIFLAVVGVELLFPHAPPLLSIAIAIAVAALLITLLYLIFVRKSEQI